MLSYDDYIAFYFFYMIMLSSLDNSTQFSTDSQTDTPDDTGICEITDRTFVGIITNPCVIIGTVTTNLLIWIVFVIVCLITRKKNTLQDKKDEEMDKDEKKDESDMDEEKPVIFGKADKDDRLYWGNEDDFNQMLEPKRNYSDQDAGLDSDQDEKRDENDTEEEKLAIFVEAEKDDRLHWGNIKRKIPEDDSNEMLQLKRNVSDQDAGLDSD